MKPELPANLKEAEISILKSLLNYLSKSSEENSYLAINLKFEGLRLNPLIYRLTTNLQEKDYILKILYPDAGATALAKRDMPKLANMIYSFSDIKRLKVKLDDSLVIVVSPMPCDTEELESICINCATKYITFNAKLEDTVLGVGNVGRKMRQRFINLWQVIYYLEPLPKGALLKMFPDQWHLFDIVSSGYKYRKSYDQKPNDEMIFMDL